MKSDKIQHIDLAGRLKDLEHFTGQRSASRESEPDAIPVHEPPAHHHPGAEALARLPAPRRGPRRLRRADTHRSEATARFD